jgi:hypothetical protein
MKQDELRRLARLGAAARLAELERERAALLRDFPGLRGSGGTADATRESGPRNRRVMSAANRRAVSIRMKKYWAARRKAKAAKA